MDDLEVVERQLGRPPRAFRRVAVRCPFGAPAVVEQEPFDSDGTPFPTQFWLTLPPPRGARRPARGRGRGRALDARRPTADPELRASLERRACRAAGAPSRAPRRDRRRDAARAASSACTPTRRSRSRGPGTSSATGSSPRPSRSGREQRCCSGSMIGAGVDIELARHQWEEGRRALERARVRPGALRAALARRSRSSSPSSTRRIGQMLHARRARGRLRRRRPLGARGDPRRVPRRGARRTSRPSPTRPSTSTRAARPTTRRERRRGRRRRRRAGAAGRARRCRARPRRRVRGRHRRSARRCTTTRRPGGTQTLVRTLHPLRSSRSPVTRSPSR